MNPAEHVYDNDGHTRGTTHAGSVEPRQPGDSVDRQSPDNSASAMRPADGTKRVTTTPDESPFRVGRQRRYRGRMAHRPPQSALAVHWSLEPETVFLNHGSFGATPSVVLDAQMDFRRQMEREPVRFFVRELDGLLATTRTSLGALLHCDADDLALVPNATTGVNSVLRSLRFAPGDELLCTDHEYNACRNTLDYVAQSHGATVVVARVPYPIARASDVTDAILGLVTPRTRIALVDHVTSQTALVFPIADIVRALAQRGVDTVVDGAHAPGMLPLDLRAIGAAYYTGNCHKWLCAPKGAAFLYVRRDRQDAIRPTVISHGANAPLSGRRRFRLEFDWMGTDDPTAWLCIPAAIDFLSSVLPGGLHEVMERNRAGALAARSVLCAALRESPSCPDNMVGAIAAVPLPDGSPDSPTSPFLLDPLQDTLFVEDGIEVPVIPWPAPPKRLLRVSSQLYNSLAQYEYLAERVVARLRGV